MNNVYFYIVFDTTNSCYRSTFMVLQSFSK